MITSQFLFGSLAQNFQYKRGYEKPAREMAHKPSSKRSTQAVLLANAPPLCKLIFETNHKAAPATIKVYLSQNSGVPPVARFTKFQTKEIKYHSFCDDFGPMNFGSIAAFVNRLDEEIAQAQSDTIVYCTEDGPRAFMNAAFLLGAYGLLKLGMSPTQVLRCFQEVDPARFEMPPTILQTSICT